MDKNEIFLEKAQETLTEILKPYQKQIRQQQQMADLLKQCIRAAEKNDFLQLDELLRNRLIESIENEPDLEASQQILDKLRKYATKQVDLYRVEFIDDVIEHAEIEELPMEIDFPRFKVLEGIEGTFDFEARQTIINQKKVKSLDPNRIVKAALQIKRRLYDRPFDPQKFIDGLYQVYQKMLKAEKKKLGHAFSMQDFYLDYVMSIQSRSFFQNMDKGKFKGYSVEQLAVDFWCYFQAETGGAKGKYAVQLRPGRNNALWLIDSDGEHRQITTISFQESK